MQKKMLILITIITLLSLSLYAGTTGKLAGKVRDAKGAPIAYANVMLKGTSIGAATDEQGRFMIINIPPGNYVVLSFLMGYSKSEIENVHISLDETKTLNITLTKTTLEGKTIIVVDKEDLIKKSVTGSEKSFNAEQMENVAVSDINGLIAIQAGVSSSGGELHVRGGRATEVQYTVDGMNVSDPVDGGRALSVDMDAVADMKVMTGGFTAEYGNAQSGIVSIVTKDGSENYEGKLEFNTDHLLSEGSNSDEVKFSLGGPLLGGFGGSLRKNLTFFLNGAGLWDDTRYRKYYISQPNEDIPSIAGVTYAKYDPYESRDDFLGLEIGNRNNNNYNVNLKVKYAFDPLKNVTFAVRGDRSLSTPYSHSWKYALQHYAQAESNQRQYLVTYDHTIGTNTNVKIKGSYYQKDTKNNPIGIDKDMYLFKTHEFNPLAGQFGYSTIDENNDGIYDNGFYDSSYWSYYIRGLVDPRPISNFNAPGTIWANFIDDKTSSINLRTDWEYQPSQFIGFKSGFEVIKHKIEKNQLNGFLTIYEKRFYEYLDSYGHVTSIQINPETGDTTKVYTQDDYYQAAKASSGTRDGYKAEPIQASYYLQDKMEWEGMIVNMGVRMDMWYLGESYQILKDDNSFKSRKFKTSDRFQLMISPRLGVSHPISEFDVMHFAYNYQNQLPQMQYIFTSRDTVDAYTSGNAVTVGNPKLEPQITITYEVGLQHQFNDDYSMDITAYYKNIYNYVSTKKVVSAQEASVYWYEFISEDYGSARGIDLSITRRLINFISGQASYSLSWAQGNNSDVVIQDFATNLREFPLDWDIRHNMNLSLTFRIDKDEQFLIPFTAVILPLDNFTASLTYSYSSGAPYTPATTKGTLTLLEPNSKRKESTSNADLKLTKTFPLSKEGSSAIRLVFTIENLFKKTNINNVYSRTGSPYYDGTDLSENNNPGYTYSETQSLHDLFTKNPSNTNSDRNYILGLSYNF